MQDLTGVPCPHYDAFYVLHDRCSARLFRLVSARDAPGIVAQKRMRWTLKKQTAQQSRSLRLVNLQPGHVSITIDRQAVGVESADVTRMTSYVERQRLKIIVGSMVCLVARIFHEDCLW
jgi:hypothetical protein